MKHGKHILLKEHPDVPDGPCEFLVFEVSGPHVRVSKYIDAELCWERTMSREAARGVWRGAMQEGYRED